MKDSTNRFAYRTLCCTVAACAVVFIWQAAPILCLAFIQALEPVLSLIGLVFVSLILLSIAIAIILATLWLIDEVCDRHRYFAARQKYREMQLKRYRSGLQREGRSRSTDADLRSVRSRVFYRRVN